ncbi:MAG: histidine phosphatase family protein, partial [Deltaproteobacteria bacterium]|nr:histidine phosphatase family protein [Deltaproteobacteria bacterium]
MILRVVFPRAVRSFSHALVRSHLARVLVVLGILVAFSGCATTGGGSRSRGDAPGVLYLARHGQTAWNRVARFQGDPDLDQVGYLNRLSLWLLLKDIPLQTIFTSTKRRTQRTAALVAKQQKLPIFPRAALDEIASGVLEGICYQYMQPDTHKPGAKDCDVPARGGRPALAKKAVARIWAKVQSKGLQGRVPLGENYGDMIVRLKPFIPELKEALARGNVLAVGHGVINRVLLHVLFGWPLKTVYKIHQENDQVYRIAGL